MCTYVCIFIFDVCYAWVVVRCRFPSPGSLARVLALSQRNADRPLCSLHYSFLLLHIHIDTWIVISIKKNMLQ